MSAATGNRTRRTYCLWGSSKCDELPEQLFKFLKFLRLILFSLFPLKMVNCIWNRTHRTYCLWGTSKCDELLERLFEFLKYLRLILLSLFPLNMVNCTRPLIVLDCVYPQRYSKVAGFSVGSNNSLNRVCQLNMAGLLWSQVEDGCPDWPASGLGTYCTQLVASVDNDKTQACFTLLDKLSAPLTELVAFLLPLSGGVTNPSLCLFYAT